MKSPPAHKSRTWFFVHRIKNQTRRREFYLKNHTKNVANIWKHAVHTVLRLSSVERKMAFRELKIPRGSRNKTTILIASFSCSLTSGSMSQNRISFCARIRGRNLSKLKLLHFLYCSTFNILKMIHPYAFFAFLPFFCMLFEILFSTNFKKWVAQFTAPSYNGFILTNLRLDFVIYRAAPCATVTRVRQLILKILENPRKS